MGGLVLHKDTRRDCRWCEYYAGTWRCKLPAIRGVKDSPEPLDLGCPKDCPDLLSVQWKRDMYPEDSERGQFPNKDDQ
jgi:hypothetical protein